MLFYFLQGATLAISAAIMPGPYQAYLLSQALRHGWKRTLPAAFAPLATLQKGLVNRWWVHGPDLTFDCGRYAAVWRGAVK